MNTPRHRPVAFWLLAGVILLVLVFLIPSLLTVTYWDGRFPLHLNIHSQSNAPIKELFYETFFDPKIARWAMAQTGEHPDLIFRPVDYEEGQFTAFVECSGKTWIFNIETHYVEPKCIMLRIVFEDGKEDRKLIDIPPGRGSRSVEVNIDSSEE